MRPDLLLAIAMSAVACGEADPCGEGRSRTEPAGLFAEIGLPRGAAHCEEGDLVPRLFFRGMTEAEAAQAMREQMTKQGWSAVDLLPAQRESILRDLTNGGSSRTVLMFVKDGTARRAHVVARGWPEAKLAVVEIDDVECPDPKTTANERSPEQRGFCP